MRIAVACDKDQIAEKFGHATAFKIYETDKNNALKWGRVIGVANMEEHEERANFLRATGVSTLICDGICKKGRKAVGAAGITFFGGVKGDPDEAVNAWLAGTLQYETDVDQLDCKHDE